VGVGEDFVVGGQPDVASPLEPAAPLDPLAPPPDEASSPLPLESPIDDAEVPPHAASSKSSEIVVRMARASGNMHARFGSYDLADLRGRRRCQTVPVTITLPDDVVLE
jgi:hypothetical protein